MIKLECKYCKNKFSTKSILNTHKKTAKYCLKIQGKKIKNLRVKCKECGKIISSAKRLKEHQSICLSHQLKLNNEKYDQKINNLEQKIVEKDKIILNLKSEILNLRELNKSFQKDMKEVAIKAVSRPSYVSNKNIQINNYIQKMEPLCLGDIKKSVPLLTLDHHVKGAEGYAEYALEFPFKNKIVCVDVSRNKIKYKNEEGDVVEDIGFRKMMMKLCDSLKDRSFKLCQDHYDKLLQKYSEEEMDNCDFDFMEAAKAIYKYASGRESDFCSKIIKLISKGSKVGSYNKKHEVRVK